MEPYMYSNKLNATSTVQIYSFLCSDKLKKIFVTRPMINHSCSPTLAQLTQYVLR